ncbi:MAG: hypothetical protein JWQ35_2661 [Bacteriovoracaceae bacterium]|nr:hypothetical protein [Bacteriovoracaceae bacterium]
MSEKKTIGNPSICFANSPQAAGFQTQHNGCIRRDALSKIVDIFSNKNYDWNWRDMMNLIQKPEVTTWPETHYIYIEKMGPFQETAPQAWQSLHKLIPTISETNKIMGNMSLYKIQPNKMTYRAGVAVSEKPAKLLEGLQYTKFEGGKYICFVLTGPYSDLPKACGRVFEIISEKKIQRRDDFNIENYVSDPKTTPEKQLITEILIPTF